MGERAQMNALNQKPAYAKMRILRHKAITVLSIPTLLILGVAILEVPRCRAQGTEAGGTDGKASAPAAKSAQPLVPEEVTKELEAMRARIDELERQLKSRDTTSAAAPTQSPATEAA